MTRVIKFRAWDKETGAISGGMTFPFPTGFSGGETQEYMKTLVWMQYTGLKDKNGVEIYEGDIVNSDAQKKPQLVKWAEDMAGFEPFVDQIPSAADSYSEWTITEIEVIGNVWENKELLK